MAVPVLNGKTQFFDATGAALALGTVSLYVPGTTTAKQAWQDQAKTVLNSTPTINLDAGGYAIIFGEGAYRQIVKDALGNTIWDQEAWANDAAADLALSTGAGIVGYSSAGTYAAGTLGLHAQTILSVTDAPFNAKCDGTTDDTAAVQAAVTYANGFSRPPAIYIPGKCKLVSTVNIDRLVDTNVAPLRFVGTGAGAGFYKTSAGAMFDSTLTVTIDPKSELIEFENILFEAPTAGVVKVMTQKFLRVTFVGCTFEKVQCVVSTIYTQEWTFDRVAVRRSADPFFRSEGAFDVVSSGKSKYQFNAGDVFVLSTTASPPQEAVTGCSFMQGEFESNGGRPLVLARAWGTAIHGCYFENNTGVSIDLSSGTDFNEGVSIAGCFFQPSSANAAITTFYDIIWGQALGCTSFGNQCLGRLHDNTLVLPGQLITNDYALTSYQKGTALIRGLPSGFAEAENGITAHAGGGQASAYQITKPLSRVTVAASIGDSVKLPAATLGGFGMTCTIINASVNEIAVFGLGTDTVNGGASFRLPSGARRTFTCEVAGAWETEPFLPFLPNSTGASAAEVAGKYNDLLAALRGYGFSLLS